MILLNLRRQVVLPSWLTSHLEEVELAAPTYLVLMRDGQEILEARPPFLHTTCKLNLLVVSS
jgi:hypothetical protein